MNAGADSDVKSCWALLWRSVVFFPCILLMSVSIGGVWLSRWILPPCIVLQLYVHEWWQAVATMVVWALLAWIYRRLRLERFFEAPPSLL